MTSIAYPTDDDAIFVALKQDWREAIRINTELLTRDAENIDALNRLGFAYLKIGELPLAKQAFQKALTLDPYNQIAQKNLKRLTLLRQKDCTDMNGSIMSPTSFIEEPGKTKIVNAINVAPTNVLSSLHCGQEVFMKPKKYCIELRDSNNIYLGALPDDLSFRLIKFLTAGNIYQIIVKSVAKNALNIFIREISRGKKYAHQPSFISQLTYSSSINKTTSTPSDKPDTTPTGEEEEAEKEEEE